MNIIKLFTTHYIEVKWDNAVETNLKPRYRGLTHARIPIRLFNLLKGLGSVQPKRVNPSLLSTMKDYDYLLERLKDEPEFKIKIVETRTVLSSEMLTEVSEFLGIGLSVAVVSELYDVQYSTISKIIGITSQRPDWSCLLTDNRILLVEAKGTTNKYTSTQQIRDAVVQKRQLNGDIRIATATVLYEDEISKMNIVDPPIINEPVNGERKHVYRAYHYASVFSFLGDAVLSLYFEKMAKRLSGQIRKREMNDKEQMYQVLNYNAPRISVNNTEYAGHLYGPFEENRYLFLGVNRQLLSYQGFRDYVDLGEESITEVNGNQFISHPDGVLVVNIKNSDSFLAEYHIESIGVSYDDIVLSDIDSIRGNSFKRYIQYLLDKCYSQTEWVNGGIVATSEGHSTKFVIYHVRNAGNHMISRSHNEKVLELMEGREGILVTNLYIPRQYYPFSYIGRDELDEIANSKGDTEIIRRVFLRDK